MSADFVVSTAPITKVPAMLNAPPEVMSAAASLKFRSLLLVYVLVRRPKVMSDVWTFVPDSSFIFQRISEQKNFSKDMGPSDKTVLITEVMCAYNDGMWNSPSEKIYEHVIRDLEKAGFIIPGEASGFYILKLKDIYPVYELGYQESLGKVISFTDSYSNFITLGRLGLFNYNNTDHCIDMAIWASDYIRNKKPVSEWVKTRKKFDEYVIVD